MRFSENHTMIPDVYYFAYKLKESVRVQIERIGVSPQMDVYTIDS